MIYQFCLYIYIINDTITFDFEEKKLRLGPWVFQECHKIHNWQKPSVCGWAYKSVLTMTVDYRWQLQTYSSLLLLGCADLICWASWNMSPILILKMSSVVLLETANSSVVGTVGMSSGFVSRLQTASCMTNMDVMV